MVEINKGNSKCERGLILRVMMWHVVKYIGWGEGVVAKLLDFFSRS